MAHEGVRSIVRALPLVLRLRVPQILPFALHAEEVRGDLHELLRPLRHPTMVALAGSSELCPLPARGLVLRPRNEESCFRVGCHLWLPERATRVLVFLREVLRGHASGVPALPSGDLPLLVLQQVPHVVRDPRTLRQADELFLGLFSSGVPRLLGGFSSSLPLFSLLRFGRLESSRSFPFPCFPRP